MLFTQPGQTNKNHDDDMTVEDMALLTEAAILENATAEEIESFLSNSEEIDAALNEEIVTERTLVRLDKSARINQQQKVAVFTIAKEKNDPKFKKLVTVWRMERMLEDDLFKKYGNEGLRRAKKNVQKQTVSGSSFVKRVANKANSQFKAKPMK